MYSSNTNKAAREIFETLNVQARNLVSGKHRKMQEQNRAWAIIDVWEVLIWHYSIGDAARDGRRRAWVETHDNIQKLLKKHGRRVVEPQPIPQPPKGPSGVSQ